MPIELEESVGFAEDGETLEWTLCRPGGGDEVLRFASYIDPEEQELIAKAIAAAFPVIGHA